jgi:hypothetical protein
MVLAPTSNAFAKIHSLVLTAPLKPALMIAPAEVNVPTVYANVLKVTVV